MFENDSGISPVKKLYANQIFWRLGKTRPISFLKLPVKLLKDRAINSSDVKLYSGGGNSPERLFTDNRKI